MTRLFSSESVTEGHPDKVCDIVSDALVDAYLTLNPDSRVAVETAIKDGLVLLEGEVSAPRHLDHAAIARKAIAEIGYVGTGIGLSAWEAGVIDNIRPRQFDSSDGNRYGNFEDADQFTKDKAYDTFGGDKGLMVGYAADDTDVLAPLPIHLASRLTERLAYVRKNGIAPLLRPDGKTLVTVEYPESLVDPIAVRHVLISTQHSDQLGLEEVREAVREHVLKPVLDDLSKSAPNVDVDDIDVTINESPFINGGPKADAGVTGRKIIVDTYGGIAGHGGGAFSGKDPRKPDRSAAYAARWVAKNVVAAGLARRAQVQISYLNRNPRPVSVDVETFGTESVSRERIQHAVERSFDLRQLAIIDQLDLRRPIYRKTAAYGHFGRTDADFTWERTDKVDELKANL